MAQSIERIESGPAWADKSSDQCAADIEARCRQVTAHYLQAQLASAVARGDANAVCPFATIADWAAIKSMPINQASVQRLPKRAMTLAEVLDQAMDTETGPQHTELYQLLLNACASSDIDLAVMAGDLRDRLVAKWLELQA